MIAYYVIRKVKNMSYIINLIDRFKYSVIKSIYTLYEKWYNIHNIISIIKYERDKRMKRGKYTASDIAKWFLQYNQEIMFTDDADLITNLKLQKLLYYAQSAFLAIKNEKLFNEPIVAWSHGPVIEDVYHYYKEYGSNGIPCPDDTISIDEEDEELLKAVYSVFGKYSAWGLRNRTHEEEPWIVATDNGTVFNRRIDENIMKDYFKNNYVKTENQR